MQAERAFLLLTVRRPSWHDIEVQACDNRSNKAVIDGHTESVLYDVSKTSRENTTRFSFLRPIKGRLTRDALQVCRANIQLSTVARLGGCPMATRSVDKEELVHVTE